MFTMSESNKSICAAYVKAWASLENVAKDSVNPHFKSRYADLAAVLNAVRPVLAAHGLAILQPMVESEKGVSVLTRLVHETGEWMESSVTFPTSDTKAQTLGAVTSYARRYALQAFLGISSDDDDGNSQKAPTKTAPQSSPTPIADVDFSTKKPADAPKTEAQAVDVKAKLTSFLARVEKLSTPDDFRAFMTEVQSFKKLRPDAEKHELFPQLQLAYGAAVKAAREKSQNGEATNG